MRRRVVFNWDILPFFGWGVYGFNLALHWSGDSKIEPISSAPIDLSRLAVDPMRRRALEPFLAVSSSLSEQLQGQAVETITLDVPLLAGYGGDFSRARSANNSILLGSPTIGVVFFELPHLSAEAVARAKALPLIITGSTWNERVLREYGVERVVTVLQGVDPTLFHPAPRSGVMQDRFLVFSGGKVELRKGQDLVIAAFRRFSAKHPEAMLVTAWHSYLPELASVVNQTGYAAPVAFNARGEVDPKAWAEASGIPPHQFLDLGFLPNWQIAPVLRDMDVALFPNRCEGGTNLVAMEAMACGVPVILSRNTGHLDLIKGDTCFTLDAQRPVAGAAAGVGGTPGWGESDVDEIVAALERVYTDRAEARRRADKGAKLLAGLTWQRTAAQMRDVVLAC